MKNNANNYVIRVLESPLEVNASDWNELLALQDANGSLNPFMRHEYVAALHSSGSAVPETGWTPRFIVLENGSTLQAVCALYLKTHSYGEYVFDWAWANAYHQHGLPYYPKAVIAPPFTPVPGPRLLARDPASRLMLVRAVMAWCENQQLSSLHLLFAADEDVTACAQAGLMLRHTVQFHWSGETLDSPVLLSTPSVTPNTGAKPTRSSRFASFDEFLQSLSQEKRKKIRQERRKVSEAGVSFRHSQGSHISASDWDFFYRCYERTYLEHGNAPYLSRDFFRQMALHMPENWLLFVAERNGLPIASSLIGLSGESMQAASSEADAALTPSRTAYGRYWGALERVDCLHFEACYYQPLQWCIEHGFERFEGGAQGEHKMARALLPVKTTSAHWLAHPSFANAVERFLAREGHGIDNYMTDLERRNPFRQVGAKD